MAIELSDPRFNPVKTDIKRALVSGYSGRTFTEEGLINSLRQTFGPEVAWASNVNFDDLIRSMPEFKDFFARRPSPIAEAPKPTPPQKTDLK